MKTTRRRFFKNIGLSILGAPLLLSYARNILAMNAKDASSFKFLTDQEAITLGAICDQIIPEDDFPGAVEAGALDYIDRRLLTRYYKSRPLYRQGLFAVEKSSLKMHGKPFFSLTETEKIAFLEKMEANTLDDNTWQGQSPARFFQLVKKHTIESYFGHPRHGGNKDKIGYKLIQYWNI